jgi:glutaredoxin
MIIIYSKPYCERCAQAKKTLSNHNISYNELVIGEDVNREDVLEMFPGVTHLPILTQNGTRVLLEALVPKGPQLLNE